MSETPRTDKHQSDCLWSGGRSCSGGNNAYALARQLEGEIMTTRKMLAENIESNRQAAINSPQNADWSNGVAMGLEIALESLTR
jgi:hypothetical protein